MNFIAGFLLFVSQDCDFRGTPHLQKEEETFWFFVSLMEEGLLHGFYRRRFPLLRRYLWAFDEMVAATLPELKAHFAKENVQHAEYLHQWFLTMFINCLPLPMVLVFWDAIVCNGISVILPITVSLLQVLQEVLLTMQFEDIIRFFKTMRTEELGSDSAAIGHFVVSKADYVHVPAHVQAKLALAISSEDSETLREESRVVSMDTARRQGLEEDAQNSTAFRSYFELSSGMLTWWEETRDRYMVSDIFSVSIQ